MSSPLPLAPFPLTLVSEHLSLAEFFEFCDKAKRIHEDYKIVRRLDILAFAVESPEFWNTPLESSEKDKGYRGPDRLVLMAFTPAMRDLLFATGMTLGRRKGAQQHLADVQDGPEFLAQVFAQLRADGIPMATVPFRVHGYDASLAMAIFARTPPAIKSLMRALRISQWKVEMMPGWSCHNRYDPMPIARVPEETSMKGFFDHANRCCNVRVGAPIFLNVQLYALGPLARDEPPERLILVSNDATLHTGLQRAAFAVGAPRRAEDLNGFAPPHNHGQPGFFATMFQDMERHGLPVVTWKLRDPEGPEAGIGETFILARTCEASHALLEKLGVGGLEPFEV